MTRSRRQAVAAAVVTAVAASVAACGGGGSGDGNRSGMMGSTTTVSLTSLTVTPTSVSGCGTAQVTATLSGAAPSGGVSVALSASPSVLVMSSITIAAGASTGSTTVTQNTTAPAVPVTAPTTVTITGSTTAIAGVAASSQVGMLSLAAPIAAFTVAGTARGSDACQITNASGQFDCSFNGSTSSGASRWTWSWAVGPASGGPQDTTTPTFQPTTGCGLFTGATVQGSPGNTFVQMIVNLTVRDAANTQSCQRQNANVRVFSGGFCGGF